MAGDQTLMFMFGKKLEDTLVVYDQNDGVHEITLKQLGELKRSLIDGQIIKIFAYENPLILQQRTNYPFNHMFLVFKTDKHWWSLEKVTEGLILQCKLREEDVRARCLADFRNPEHITEIRNAEGHHSIWELIDWLYDKKELDRKYNVETDNCQNFGTRVYEFVTRIGESRSACAIDHTERGHYNMALVQGTPFGGNWKDTLFYYDKFNYTPAPTKIKQDRLEELIKKLGDEKIIQIYVYKNPLFYIFEKITDLRLFFHMFLVIQTETDWWSIEKVTEGIILQCKSDVEDVRSKRAGEDRNPKPITLIKNAEVQKGIRQLIQWLFDNNELGKTYNVRTDNCQHFGSRVFKFVTGMEL